MRLYFIVFSLVFFSSLPFCYSQPGDSSKTLSPEISTEFLENLDSLANMYYVKQALKLQNNNNGEKAGENIPVESDSVIARRLSEISSIIPLPYNSVVRAFIDVYTLRKRKFVEAMLGLTDYYFPMFEEVFNLYGLPHELKYLSIVSA